MLFDVFKGTCNKLMLIPKATHERISEKAIEGYRVRAVGEKNGRENVHKTQRRPWVKVGILRWGKEWSGRACEAKRKRGCE
jgi:hypothetical protein